MKRREFVQSAAAAIAAATSKTLFAQAPAVRTGGVRPVGGAAANGNRFKNGGAQNRGRGALPPLAGGGRGLCAPGVARHRLAGRPPPARVGSGGLPNADGVVQLDSCCMHGPRKRAGGVAALEGVRTPSLVAQAVMDTTDHHLLVGKGAQDFARQMGFTVEDDLNTEHSRMLWLEWKRRIDPQHYLDPKKRGQAWFDAGLQMAREGLIYREHYYGTINCNGGKAKGEEWGVTRPSGLALYMTG